jgi:mannose-1-phosphate guanylyltransferase
MKAFLLAGGLGTRLRPLTDQTPKCLLPIHGRPMLEVWLSQLAQCQIDEVLVNTHHLHKQVETFAQTWKSTPKLRLAHEPSLLGSAGTLSANRSFVENEEIFLVCYADNLTAFDVSALAKALRAKIKERPLGVMALHRSEEPHRCGIATLDEKGWIHEFVEKPQNPKSNLANSGLYAFHRDALDLLPAKTPADISYDFIPKLIPRLLSLEMNAPLIDIGTVEAYENAQKLSDFKPRGV